jgi:hypothetical protein
MAGVPPIDLDRQARAKSPRARRSGWFSRASQEQPAGDQEAEVRARLYAKPAATERTVHIVERLADRPAA